MSAIPIPDTLPECQSLIEQLLFTIDEQNRKYDALQRRFDQLQAKYDALEKEHAELKREYAELKRRILSHQSERYLDIHNEPANDGTNNSGAEGKPVETPTPADELETQAIGPYIRRATARKRRVEQLPTHLPREYVEATVSDDVRYCPTHGERTLIGHDDVETLMFTPSKLWVRVTRYPKYACANHAECGVAAPRRPTGLVEGNRYDASVAAEILASKYALHLPIYRMEDCFASSGWTPGRSTLLNILAATARLLRPLVEYFKQTVLASGCLGTDDTRVTLLIPANIPKPEDAKSRRIHEAFTEALARGKKSVSGRMWAYRGMTVELNVFDFTVSRHRDGPDLFLEDFTGAVMGDCYSGYQRITLRTRGAIVRAACNAHARRKVFDARQEHPRESSLLLAWYQQLYDIEDRGKAMSADERMALRQAEAKPIWRKLENWLAGDQAARILPKSQLGQALGYLRRQREALQAYLDDGRLPIDNNDVEQLMKQVALGRKNWLFIGSIAAGERAADCLTLVSSALRNDLDVWAYVKDVLDQLLAGSADYESLRPDVWKAAHPDKVRQYRERERRDRADRKQRHRSARRLAPSP